MLRTRHLLYLVLFVMVATACVPQTPPLVSEEYLEDESLLTGEPCEPPCWNGITPGETTWEEALEVLESDDSVNGLDQQEAEGGTVLAAWQDGESELYCCRMLADDPESVVKYLFLQIAPNFIIDDVLDAYGEPEYVAPATLTDTDAVLQLVYAEVPMLVWVYVGEPGASVLANSQVVAVIYLTAEEMELSLVMSNLYAWDGYQPYSAYEEATPVATPRITPTAQPEE
jgi:hypothetical protein